jgi:hypothetical protein
MAVAIFQSNYKNQACTAHIVDKETIKLRLVRRIYMLLAVDLQVDRVILKTIIVPSFRVNRAGCHHWNKNYDWLDTLSKEVNRQSTMTSVLCQTLEEKDRDLIRQLHPLRRTHY